MQTNENGNLRCIFCGGDLCWNADNDLSEVRECVSEDDGGVVGSYTCMTCGREYEIYDPPKEEREGTYKDYWSKTLNKVNKLCQTNNS